MYGSLYLFLSSLYFYFPFAWNGLFSAFGSNDTRACCLCASHAPGNTPTPSRADVYLKMCIQCLKSQDVTCIESVKPVWLWISWRLDVRFDFLSVANAHRFRVDFSSQLNDHLGKKTLTISEDFGRESRINSQFAENEHKFWSQSESMRGNSMTKWIVELINFH